MERGLMTTDKYGYIKGFEIVGENMMFYYVKAFISDNKVIAYSDKVNKPIAVHYGWSDDAREYNLYNKEGFPASPFRTDNWDGITNGKKYILEK